MVPFVESWLAFYFFAGLEAKDQIKRGGKLDTWGNNCLQVALTAYHQCQVQINLKLHGSTLREHKDS